MDETTLEIRAVVALLRRQVRLIVAILLIAILAAIGYVAYVHPRYTATALVMVEPNRKALVYQDSADLASPNTDSARVDSEVEIARSPAVLLSVVESEKLTSDPEFGPRLGTLDRVRQALGFRSAPVTGEALVKSVLDRFARAVTVRRRGLTYLLAVSVELQDPDRAARLANAVTSAYIGAQVNSKVASRLGARDKLRQQIASAQQSLTSSEQSIDDYISRNLGRLELATGDDRIGMLHDRLSGLERQRLATDVRANAARAALKDRDWAAVTRRLGSDALASQQQQRAQLQQQLGLVPEGSGKAVDLKGALDALNRQQSQIALQAISQLDASGMQLDKSISETRDQVRATLLNANLPPQALSQIYQLQQGANVARDQYQTLLSRLREVEVQAAVQVPDSRVVSPALPPVASSFPDSRLILMMALVAGLGLGVGLAFLNEYYVGGIVSEAQLRDVLRRKVATGIPPMSAKSGGELSIADRVVSAPLSTYSEAIRRLRAGVELELRQIPATPGPSGKPLGRTIVVTSSNPGEGKSTTALALARAFALSRFSVLLIDGDLRKPTLHDLAGIRPARGLIDYLSDPGDETPVETLLTPDPLTSATLINGRGRAFQQTDQLLASETFQGLVDAAREAFDLVIIDTPPVLPVVDTRYLVPFGEVVVMVVRFGATSQPDLRSAARTVTEVITPDQALLTALNHEPSDRSRSRYYKGYYSE